MKNTKEKGFTIIELIIVLAVISILSSILIPAFTNIISRASKASRDEKLKYGYIDYVTKNADNSFYYSQNELYFVIDNKIYGFENNEYSVINIDGVELTEDNAEKYGFEKLTETYNSMNTYIFAGVSKPVVPDEIKPDDGDESDSGDDNDDKNEAETLLDKLTRICNEIINSGEIDISIDSICFAVAIDDDTFDLYMCSNPETKEFSSMGMLFSLEEIEDQGCEFVTIIEDIRVYSYI